MKKLVALLAAVALLIMLASPVLAFGISPPSVEFDVPADSSVTHTFTVYDFTGDLRVSLEDIPLKVEPITVYVAAGDEGTKIEVTFYGDDSLGSQVYNGYVRFLAMTGGTIATGIKVHAKINHIVAGEPLPKETPPPEEAPPEQPPPEATTIEEAPPEAAPLPPTPQGGIGGLPLTTVIIIAGGLVFLGLVALAISLAVRRRY